ncbi:MAG: hypothetical protein QOG23_3519 [Blastocatellia bacterium]|nr:hypothetical protein [Blastocatellia bacterium]
MKSFLPLPLGEGWGEGLPSRDPLSILSLNATCPHREQENRIHSQALIPRPFSQREKGEKNLSPSAKVEAFSLRDF